jgi:radical SAM/Cys-rich protein
MLRRFNDLGYGQKETGLVLNLVYNPPGAILPGSQRDLEGRYRKELIAQGIAFNSLFVLANMALGRFRDFLIRTQGLESYMASVRKAFNPGTVEGLMCRHIVSVRWDGMLFDCDFNQVLDITVDSACPRHIADFDAGLLAGRRVMADDHCFVCTAGAGTTCQGAIA